MSTHCIDGGTMTIGDRAVPIEVRVNPRARRLILRLGRERRITVTCPSRGHVPQALRMVESQRGWLMDQLARAPDPVPFAVGEVLPVFGQDRVVVAADRPTFAAELTPHRIIAGGRDTEATHRRIAALLKRTVRSAICEETEKMASSLDVSIARITVREMTSRWGSCSTDGALSFNWRLVFAPREILAYVCAHEVAHRLEMNHSPAFWRQVRRLYPDYRCAERWLDEFGGHLHAFGQNSPK